MNSKIMLKFQNLTEIYVFYRCKGIKSDENMAINYCQTSVSDARLIGKGDILLRGRRALVSGMTSSPAPSPKGEGF
jgi:hypothetical protein